MSSSNSGVEESRDLRVRERPLSSLDLVEDFRSVDDNASHLRSTIPELTRDIGRDSGSLLLGSPIEETVGCLVFFDTALDVAVDDPSSEVRYL